MKFKIKLDLKNRLQNYRRVLTIAEKPTFEEFKKTARICALGIIGIGFIGFIIYIIALWAPF